jgi:hypothetical protein
MTGAMIGTLLHSTDVDANNDQRSLVRYRVIIAARSVGAAIRHGKRS